MKECVPIAEPEQLARLRHAAGRRDVASIRLMLPVPGAERLERRINRNLHPCGCEVGAALTGLLMVVAALHIAASFAGVAPPVDWLAWFGLLIAGALLGKAAGFGIGILLLHRTIDSVLVLTVGPSALPTPKSAAI